ncbi:hypothetical protein Zm00014a_037892 [Zea mays]|uniref:Uncharacterized protein n=1 Tax=Zea mays TaxID=4577 RepID=A0A3L6DZI6_MAIZE|nr:hypothetical protein Zm00014a_037892 [Zea mays]
MTTTAGLRKNNKPLTGITACCSLRNETASRGCYTFRRAPCAHRKGAREGALRRAAVFGSEGWAQGLGRRGCRNSGVSPSNCAARESGASCCCAREKEQGNRGALRRGGEVGHGGCCPCARKAKEEG